MNLHFIIQISVELENTKFRISTKIDSAINFLKKRFHISSFSPSPDCSGNPFLIKIR